jgi:O-antigen ligase
MITIKWFSDKDAFKTFLGEVARIIVLCLPCTFLLPVQIAGSLIISLFIIWLYLSLSSAERFNVRLNQNICAVLFWIYFGLQLASLLYSADFKYGLRNVEVKLPFFVFPLLFFTGYDLVSKLDLKKALFVFSQGIFLTCSYVLVRIFLASDSFQTAWHTYTFTSLSNVIGVHPGYFSLYICFAILVIVAQITAQRKLVKLLLGAEVLIFLLFVFRLTSRMPIVGLILCLVFFIFFEKRYKLLLVGIVLAILFFLAAGSNRDIRERYLAPLELMSEGDIKGLKDYVFNRHQIYTCALHILSGQSLIAGLGVGDANNMLFKCYEDQGYDWILSQRYNAHNEFLQTCLETGIFGLLILVFLMLYPVVHIRLFKEFFFLTLLFGIFSLTEATLQVHKGVIFFSFFYTLFVSFVVNIQKRSK